MPPTSILLATDLGPRSDRARDRAIQLARMWRARLAAVVVVPEQSTGLRDRMLPVPAWARQASPSTDAMKALHRDLGDSGVDVDLRVLQGDPGQELLRLADQLDCGLLVVGNARGGPLFSARLGTTPRWLGRHVRQPLLVVRDPPSLGYRHLAIATDLSTSAQRAGELALSWFGPGAEAVGLVHGLHMPRSILLDGMAPGDADQAGTLAAREQLQAMLDQAMPRLRPGMTGHVVVDATEPARLVQAYIDTHAADLAIVASRGRTALAKAFLGSTATRILDETRCDVLLVPDREPPGSGEVTPVA